MLFPRNTLFHMNKHSPKTSSNKLFLNFNGQILDIFEVFESVDKISGSTKCSNLQKLQQW